MRDFDRYRIDASVPLASDFFVPDHELPLPGVTDPCANPEARALRSTCGLQCSRRTMNSA
jgi:hypothetical protein